MKYLVTVVIVLTAAVYSNMAFAWEANKPYIRASVGQFSFDGATSGYFNGIFFVADEDTIGLDGIVGFPFSDNVAIEGGFSYFTEADWSASAGGITVNGTVDAYALTVATVLRLPINKEFGIFGKLGGYMLEAESSVKVPTGEEISVKDDDTDVLAGVGVDFWINKSVSFVAGYDHYDAGNFVHIGVRFTPQTMR